MNVYQYLFFKNALIISITIYLIETLKFNEFLNSELKLYFRNY